MGFNYGRGFGSLIIGGVFIFLIVVGFVFEGVFVGVFVFYYGIKKSIV